MIPVGVLYLISVDNIRLNYERATEHLNALDKALGIYYEGNPCVIASRFDVENQRDIILLQVTKIPDMRLGILAGDFLYNLRACLDHLFWQLALIESGGRIPNNPKLIEFPISYKDNVSDKNRAWLASKLCYVPKSARSIIESLQPYTAGPTEANRKTHPLYLLNTLCNIAKHRVIPVRSMMAEIKIPNIPGISYKPLENASWEISIPTPHPTIFPPRASIMFGNIEDEIDVDVAVIGKVYDFVTTAILPKFADFFIEDTWFQAMKIQ
jgi:hypothetical protein